MLRHAHRGRKYAEIRRVLLLTLVGNLLVAAAKLVVGSLTATLSMVADGYHSLLDGVSNVGGLLAIRYAYEPPDEDHQYGHRKYESVSAMAVSVLLFIASYHILREAVERFFEPVEPDVRPLSFIVMGTTLLFNLAISTWERHKGTELRSPFLLSDAEHTRTDVFATLTVIISLVASRAGYPMLDPIASVVIAAIIARAGYQIARDGLGVISDAAVIEPERVEQVLSDLEDIKGCTAVRTRGQDDQVFMDLTVLVLPSLTVGAAHDLVDRVEEHLREAFPDVVDIVVHVEPAPPRA